MFPLAFLTLEHLFFVLFELNVIHRDCSIVSGRVKELFKSLLRCCTYSIPTVWTWTLLLKWRYTMSYVVKIYSIKKLVSPSVQRSCCSGIRFTVTVVTLQLQDTSFTLNAYFYQTSQVVHNFPSQVSYNTLCNSRQKFNNCFPTNTTYTY